MSQIPSIFVWRSEFDVPAERKHQLKQGYPRFASACAYCNGPMSAGSVSESRPDVKAVLEGMFKRDESF
jgi:hypothetical protein